MGQALDLAVGPYPGPLAGAVHPAAGGAVRIGDKVLGHRARAAVVAGGSPRPDARPTSGEVQLCLLYT
ncbi:hypothetical protein, partial [Streptomyces sp. rh34]|uniref:hypothetical protein n=1 Tax=Streptomyces sp. rh34 TaxID=2034272 RepID=UPI001C54DDFF